MILRPLDPETDLESVVDLLNSFETVPVTLEQMRRWVASLPPGRLVYRAVALDADGGVVGYGCAVHEPWYAEGHFYLWVIVDKRQRDRGIGARLYEDVLAFARQHGAASLESEVREDDLDSQDFAFRRGYRVSLRLFESVLNLDAFDDAPYQAYLADLRRAGIRFFTMAEEGDTAGARRKLYELNLALVRDIPGSTEEWFSLEDFEQNVCGAPWYRPEGQILAADGERWVAMSAVMLVPEKSSSYNLVTGVLREYRGRKLAQALKLLAVAYARQHGAHSMRTSNNSLNESMLAVNRKLGYAPEPGKIVLRIDRLS